MFLGGPLLTATGCSRYEEGLTSRRGRDLRPPCRSADKWHREKTQSATGIPGNTTRSQYRSTSTLRIGWGSRSIGSWRGARDVLAGGLSFVATWGRALTRARGLGCTSTD